MPVRKRTARSTSVPDAAAVNGEAEAQAEPALATTTAAQGAKEAESGMRKIVTRARMAFLMMGGFLFIVFGCAFSKTRI